jgi:hypothetical protein
MGDEGEETRGPLVGLAIERDLEFCRKAINSISQFHLVFSLFLWAIPLIRLVNGLLSGIVCIISSEGTIL